MGHVILNEGQCRDAAFQLEGRSYVDASGGTNFPAGCWEDETLSQLHFNTITDLSLANPPYGIGKPHGVCTSTKKGTEYLLL